MSSVLHVMSIMAYLVGYQIVVAHPWNTEVGRSQGNQPNMGFRGSPSSPHKLSSSCQLAAAGLLASEFGTCANVLELVSIFDAKDSLVSPINDWVSGACSATPCRQEGLARASRMIRTGCQQDLEEKSVAATALYSVITHYNATRDMFCTQYKENLNYCLPSVLGNVESESGQKITVDEVMSLLAGKFTAADPAFMSVPKEAYCNPCGQAIVSQSAAMMDAIREDPVGIQFNFHSGDTVHQISDICGPAFEDQTLPNAVQVALPQTGKAHRQVKEARPEAEEARPQAEESRPQAEESRPQAEEARSHAEESRPQAEEARPQAEEARPSGEDA
ncbi:hypothetical protein Pst134EA_002653 [Puccinia striiformis f. sp. tritici]|uniref:hypothetical protein n=1 Tax=Puccinia striiformis f. sp. tritici TaxID=168172 RepID=UPI002007675E|nr:hypothetical protein Pst134EA_002653 [Puccinia striiformis f. sp. tritici]KAH9472025.1 hypothetical protein Pst134EA_002653 [Puccinia striiformis f. sp. tritici]